MLLSNLELLATAPGGVARLRELILTLAVQGKLVPQDPADEPASVLLQKIRAEKDRLIAEGKIKRDKPLAEIAEEEKPFELPEGWAWVRLGEVVEVLDSLRKPVTKEDRLPGPYPYYGASGIVDYVSAYIFDEPLVLVGEDGAKWGAGDKTAFPIAGKTWVNNHAHVLKPVRAALEDMYLVNFLTARDLSEFITGMTVPKLNQARLTSIPVALPPLPEQFRIVTRVEALMRLCDALEAKGQLEAAQHAQLVSTLLGTLTASSTSDELADNWQRVAQHFDLLLDRPEAIDALEQTLLQLAVRGLLVPQDPNDEPASVLLKKIRAEKDRLIATGQIKRDKPLPPITEEEKPFALPAGWEWVRLGLLTSLITSGSRSWKDFYAKEGATFIRSQDIKYDRLEFDERAFVKLPAGAEGVRTQVQLHDLLVTITGANVGKAAAVLERMPEAYVSQHVALVRMLEVRLVDYLHLLLVSEHEGRKLLLASSYGAKPGLNLQNINDLLVPLPTLAEQSRIVTRVNALRRLCADLRQRLAERLYVQARLAEALVQEVA
ncbi:MAG: restriction endonuclease subunit S [Acidovorax soli]|uniref:restriction endonuclease subunit S n=1 Tax=Acidovorax soli TaxID=592050 RepID=UPI0026F0E186|nr:restriction endonuclease subunit S [Acidovorax soli]MCM2346107.1 restriction endonuclease subunit S [Acidovorax soli]